ncbi:MAG: hypothetical protein AAB551_01745 [Patescibacteria group bacterium]
MKHILKPKAYLRYGDDFILIETDGGKLKSFRTQAAAFLQEQLKLNINPKSDKIPKAKHGLRFLGVILWPSGRKLNKRNQARIKKRLSPTNIASYRGMLLKHSNKKNHKAFHWLIYEELEHQFLN